MRNRQQQLSFVPPIRRVGGISDSASASVSHVFPPTFAPSTVPHSWTTTSSRLSATTPLYSAHRAILATTTTAAASPTRVVGIVHLFLSFLAGGIFFGALFAGFTTFVAVGGSNIHRLWGVAKSVIARVWSVFVFGLNETRLALRMDGRWQWRQAWQVFQTKMSETRKAAAEGMDAIMQEKSFYAGVVGEPGLITAQYFVNRLLPFSLSTQMENALENSLKQVKNEFIRRVVLESFTAGGVAPELLEARSYDLGSDALAFDVDVNWESQAQAKMKVYTKGLGVKVPVTVRNPSFQGTARVVLSPLTPEPPGWGAILVSMESVPKISLDVQAAGSDMTKIPWLKREIMNGLQQQIQQQFLWPKRIVIPSLAVPPSAKTVISKKELDALSTTDPLLQKEEQLEKNEALKDHVQQMKPNATDIPSNLEVSVGDNATEIAQTTNVTATHVIDSSKGKGHQPFRFNLIPHYKNTTKTPV